MGQRDKKGISFIILLFVTICCNSSFAQYESLIQKCEFPEPKIIKNVSTFENVSYDSLEIKSLKKYGAPGEPVMLFKTVRFLIPQDKEPAGIEIITGNQITLDGNYRIEFRKTPVPLLLNYKLPDEDTPNMEIYSSSSPFPGKLYTQLPLQKFRGYKILILNLHPVQYVPKDGLISYFKDMTVVVNLKPSLEIIPFFRNLTKDKTEVLRKVDNPGIANTYTTKAESQHKGCICDPCDSYNYVIITNNDLKNSTSDPNLNDLVNWKLQKGVSATIVTVEQIENDPDYEWDGFYGDGTSFFDDTAAHIRNFIKDAYINWETDYVLLVGDGDGADVGGESGDDIIPVRYLYAISDEGGTSDQIPADLYYAALDDNWNDDEDDKWGEYSVDEPDFKAEVYVGRAPVDSEEELSNFVMKTIAYETNFEPYLKNALMVGEKLSDFPLVWGGDYKDEVADGSSADYYTTVGFSEDFNIVRLYDRDYPGNDWPKSEVINFLNNDVHLINHVGHTSVLYAMKLCNAPVYQEGPYCGESGNTDVDDLTNNRYCFIYSPGCYSGAFDNWHYGSELPPYPGGYTKSDSISEHFVTSEHGAFAVIMNSRYGWGGAYSPSQVYDREFWDAVFGEGITHLGSAHQDAKEDNEDYLEDDYMRWCYYELNLLGDPELELKTKLGGYVDVVADVNGCVEPFSGDNYLVFDINWDANGFADTNVMIIDYLPNDLDYYSSEPQANDYNSAYNIVIWFLDDISGSDYGSVQITTKVNEQSCPCGKITNVVSLKGDNYYSESSKDVNVCFRGDDIIFVDKEANDANYNNGTSWTYAYLDLTNALKMASNCPNSFDSVWISAGTYKPVYNTADGFEEKSFELVNDLALIGHFAGFETSPNQRNLDDANNKTVLEGEIETDKRINKIITAEGIDGAFLDGFTIESAVQNGVYIDDSNISIVNCELWSDRNGIYCDNSSELDIHNCLFSDNDNSGLTVIDNDSNVIASNCIFDDNDPEYYSEYGVYIENSFVELNHCLFKNIWLKSIYGKSSNLKVKDCNIHSTWGSGYEDGIGIYSEYCNLLLERNRIHHNAGDGLNILGNYPATIINNWIYNNDGSGIHFTNPISSLNFRNNTIFGNNGYGIALTYSPMSSEISNCIIYDNSSGEFSGTFSNVNFCCLENAHAGNYNIVADPDFMNIETDPNDLHISGNSPCKDTGDSNNIPSGETDIDDEDRIMYGKVDRGADEYYWSLADFDLSGNVDFIDYAILANAFRCASGEPNYVKKCDLDNNNIIDLADLELFCDDWLWQGAWNFGGEEMMMCMGGGEGLRGGLMLYTEQSLTARPQRPATLIAEESTPVYIDEDDILEALEWLDKIWLDCEELRESMTEEEFLEFRKLLEEDLLRLLKGD